MIKGPLITLYAFSNSGKGDTFSEFNLKQKSMCLIINSIHYNRRNKIKPFEARKDILVYKRLIVSDYGQLITPYRCYPINFKDGVCELQAEFGIWRNEVSQGIHAYTAPDTRQCGYYNAVIPKGTKFFIGWCNDIVAEKLIIYTNNAPSNAVPISKYKHRKFNFLDSLTNPILSFLTK